MYDIECYYNMLILHFIYKNYLPFTINCYMFLSEFIRYKYTSYTYITDIQLQIIMRYLNISCHESLFKRVYIRKKNQFVIRLKNSTFLF